jgi:trehalose utilization protein
VRVWNEGVHERSTPALADVDVLVWWGHVAHDRVDDTAVARVQDRVLGGMGLLVLHSGHYSKIFTRLMGTTCSLRWRNAGERELVWTVAPSHPIAEGLRTPHELFPNKCVRIRLTGESADWLSNVIIG